MPIVYSTYEVGVPQADGRVYVTETHTDSHGEPHVIEYGPVGADLDFAAVMTERAQQLGDELDRLELQDQLATNYRTPISPFQFMLRWTVQERVAARAAATTDPLVEDFIHLLSLATSVNTAHEVVVQGLAYLVSINVLTADRAAEIGV